LHYILADGSESPSEESSHQKISTGTQTTSQDEHSGSQSDDDDESEISDEIQHKEERNINIEINYEATEAHIKSELKNGDFKNLFEVTISAKDKIEVQFQYSSKNDQNESELQIEIEFRRIIEFIDNSSNINNIIGGYDSTDTVVKSFDFGSIH
jgi:hypothetical protein